jgi:hypothetical protein
LRLVEQQRQPGCGNAGWWAAGLLDLAEHLVDPLPIDIRESDYAYVHRLALLDSCRNAAIAALLTVSCRPSTGTLIDRQSVVHLGAGASYR